MTDRLAPPEYRLLAPRATAGTDPAGPDDLANVEVAPLPNRAMCWGAGVLYQLDKSLTGTTVIVGGVATQVQPNSGGGLWLPLLGNNEVQILNVADATELAAINTTNLPNHTLAWAGDTLYQLDQNQTGTTFLYADGVALQVDPTTGTGLWIAMQGVAVDRLNFFVDLVPSGVGVSVLGPNEWALFNSLGYTIGGSPDIAPMFGVSGNLLITYNGPLRPFRFDMYATVSNSSGANTTLLELAFSDNLTPLFTTTTDVSGRGSNTTVTGLDTQVSASRILTMADNSILGEIFSVTPVMRTVNGDSLAITSGKLVVTALPL